jgi:hypothetical protein
MGSCIKKSKEIKIQNNNINNNINVGKNEDKNIENEIEEELPENPSGFFFKNEGSFAKVRLNEEQKSICAFTSDNKIIIVTSNGMYYQAQIDIKKGGDCKIIFSKDLNKE